MPNFIYFLSIRKNCLLYTPQGQLHKQRTDAEGRPGLCLQAAAPGGRPEAVICKGSEVCCRRPPLLGRTRFAYNVPSPFKGRRQEGGRRDVGPRGASRPLASTAAPPGHVARRGPKLRASAQGGRSPEVGFTDRSRAAHACGRRGQCCGGGLCGHGRGRRRPGSAPGGREPDRGPRGPRQAGATAPRGAAQAARQERARERAMARPASRSPPPLRGRRGLAHGALLKAAGPRSASRTDPAIGRRRGRAGRRQPPRKRHATKAGKAAAAPRPEARPCCSSASARRAVLHAPRRRFPRF